MINSNTNSTRTLKIVAVICAAVLLFNFLYIIHLRYSQKKHIDGSDLKPSYDADIFKPKPDDNKNSNENANNKQQHHPTTAVPEKQPENSTPAEVEEPVEDVELNNLSAAPTAMLVMTYNRPHYLIQTLNSLLKLPGFKHLDSIIISQDGDEHPQTTATIKKFQEDHEGKHPNFPKKFYNTVRPRRAPTGTPGSAHIAMHYKHALDYAFLTLNHKYVIIIEDDIIFTPDALQYFDQTSVLFDKDSTVWCVSSWNDNGFKSLVVDDKKLYRTHFFPGLGWMTSRDIWEELSPKFATDQWDYWMRVSTVHKYRDCVFPEISRNRNIGVVGTFVSQSLFDSILKNIAYSQSTITDFGNLDYLISENYERDMQDLVNNAKVLPLNNFNIKKIVPASSDSKEVYLLPYTVEHLRSLLGVFGIGLHELRSHHYFTTLTRHPIYPMQITFILADARHSRYLQQSKFDSFRIDPRQDMKIMSGKRGETCVAVCRQNQLECDASQFDFINTCEANLEHFPCENGCKIEWGFEIPVYVEDPNIKTYQQCLITWSQVSACESSHPSTTRLCPCVPK